MTLDDMATVIQSMFDTASTAKAQGYVQEAYRRVGAETGWVTSNAAIGTTTAGTAVYALAAGITSVRSLQVAGDTYRRVGEFDITELQEGDAFRTSSEGVFSQTSSSTGVDQIVLYPTPDTSSLAITGIVEGVPADLVTGSGAGSAPVFNTDLHPVVLDGAIAIAYLREDGRADLASVHEQKFIEGIGRVRARKRRRVSGHGPFQIRVQGYHW